MSRNRRHFRISCCYLGLLAACGGTTQNSDGNGASNGGTSGAGAVSSAGNASAGKSSAGHGNGGTSSGGANDAGSGGIVIITPGGTIGTGGAPPLDPRCPGQRPEGKCKAEDSGLSCQYSVGDNCLCYPTAPGTFALCQKVDPMCPQPGASGAPSGGSAGAGGVSAKIAVPPRQRCTCSAGMWSCAFGT